MTIRKRVHLIHQKPHNPTIVETFKSDESNNLLCFDPETNEILVLELRGFITPPDTNWRSWVPQQGFTVEELKTLFSGEKDA